MYLKREKNILSQFDNKKRGKTTSNKNHNDFVIRIVCRDQEVNKTKQKHFHFFSFLLSEESE